MPRVRKNPHCGNTSRSVFQVTWLNGKNCSPISEYNKHTDICTFEAVFVCTLRELFIVILMG